MKKIFIIVGLIISFCFLNADRIDDIISDTKTDISLENATALNLFTKVELTLNNDSTYTYHVFYIKKILTYKGKKRYSDLKIAYNPEYEKVVINNCITIDPQGNRISIPKNQFYDIDDQMAVYSPQYVKRKEIVLNFPQIEPGYYIVVDYQKENFRKIPLSGVEHLQETNPYVNKIFTLSYPKNFELLSYYPTDKNVKHEKNETESKIIESWKIHNSPLIKKEKNQPSYLLIGTPIVYTFYKNWEECASKKLSNFMFTDIPEDIKINVRELIRNCTDNECKLKKIYEYFARNFTIHFSYLGDSDYNPLPLSTIQSQKFGSVVDITALFLAYAREAQIHRIYPALILEADDRFSEIQANFALDQFIDKLVLNYDGNILIPGNKNIPYKYGDIFAGTIVSGYTDIDVIKYRSEHKFDSYYTYNYDFTKDKPTVEITALLSGKDNKMMRQRYMNVPFDRTKIYFINSLNLKSAKLTDGPNFKNFDRFDEDLELKYMLQYEDLLVKQDKFSYFKTQITSPNIDVSKNEREYDYIIPQKIHEIDKVILNLKKGKKVINLPPQKEITLEINGIKAFYKSKVEENKKTITIKREIFIPQEIVSTDLYKKFRSFVLDIKNEIGNGEMIFLK